jgi:hypothetical protein
LRHGDGRRSAGAGLGENPVSPLQKAIYRHAVGPEQPGHCRLSGPEFATIAATGGITSATADITIAGDDRVTPDQGPREHNQQHADAHHDEIRPFPRAQAQRLPLAALRAVAVRRGHGIAPSPW